MAASAWQKLFPDGRGLLNGNHLNRLFTAAAKIQSIWLSSNLNVDGVTTLANVVSTGSVTVKNEVQSAGGTVTIAPTFVTATGSTQLGAKALTAYFNYVIQASTASTKGIRLPAAVTGLQVMIANAGAFGVKVWPSTNGKIGAASTNSADGTVLAVNKANIYLARNKTYWAVMRGA
jgi:hypothetical protein